MVGETMIGSYTTIETIETTCGNTIIFRPELVEYFFKTTKEENWQKLTPEEKEKTFKLEIEYADLDIKVMEQPLHDMLNEMNPDLHIGVSDKDHNPVEVYEHHLNIPKDEAFSEEEWELKLARLKEHKEWFEKQNQ
jgi:hypothetical protein